MPRFVILRHDPPASGEKPLHWDLMLESGDRLLTWAMESEPAANHPIPARQLGDHRPQYLDYEGPISGDRGTVSRWDRGDFEWQQQIEGNLLATLHGEILRGFVRLTRLAQDQRWEISFSEGISTDVR